MFQTTLTLVAHAIFFHLYYFVKIEKKKYLNCVVYIVIYDDELGNKLYRLFHSFEYNVIC